MPPLENPGNPTGKNDTKIKGTPIWREEARSPRPAGGIRSEGADDASDLEGRTGVLSRHRPRLADPHRQRAQAVRRLAEAIESLSPQLRR